MGLGGLMGCRASLPADFEAPDAGSRIRAVVANAQEPSADDLRGMVDALATDDPALRTLAIAALERTAGERFGYDPWAPEGERREAIGRWRQWLDAR
jgi:hypothetical protein